MAPRTKQEAAISDSVEELPVPGTNVVARAKGYPPWPAMVLRESDVPADVLAKKPGKKVSLPVLFYNDMSYLWVLPTEVQPLSHEQALKNSNGKIKRALKEAYAMVAESPEDYPSKLAQMLPKKAPDGTKNDETDVPEFPEPSAEQTPVEVEEPPVSSSRARSAADQAAEQLAKTRVTRSRKRAAESPVPESIKKPRKSAAKPLRDAAEDEDESEYVEQSESASDTYSVQTLSNSLAARVELCQQVRAAIQDNLLVKPLKSLDAVASALDRIEEAPEIEVAAARRSKLQRVIVAALMQELPEEIAVRLRKLADQWTTHGEPVIRGIPEHLAPKEEPEAPESRESTPGPADTREPSVELAADFKTDGIAAASNGASELVTENGQSTANGQTTENGETTENAQNSLAGNAVANTSSTSAAHTDQPSEPASLTGSSAEVKMESGSSNEEST